ncbi:MAG: CinA family protein [Bacilli bacterium]|nr:CinA family protein [Bacilli bacterium]
MANQTKIEQVIKALREKNLTLGCVESLTAGLFAATVATVPGASDVFHGGLITYRSEEKVKLLGIDNEEIIKYGVVSQHIANEMAIKGRKKLGVDICVSFTGNAGPTAEPGCAPVGRVNMSISSKFGIVELQQDFEGLRNEIREACVDRMLDQLILILA